MFSILTVRTFEKRWKKTNVPMKESAVWRKLSRTRLLRGCRGEESSCQAGDAGSIPVSGRSLGGGKDNLLQYCYLENPMDRGAWRATAHGVAKSRTRLSDGTQVRWRSWASEIHLALEGVRFMCCFYWLNQALHKNFKALAILQGRDTDSFWALKAHLSRCSAYLFAGHLAPPFHLFPCTIRPYALGVSMRDVKEHALHSPSRPLSIQTVSSSLLFPH